MDSTGINLPIVIQQSGVVSREADLVQRQAMTQQEAAQQAVQRQREEERSAVPRPQRADAENRVRTDGQGGGGQGQAPQQGPGRRPPEEKSAALPNPEAGSVLDVVV